MTPPLDRFDRLISWVGFIGSIGFALRCQFFLWNTDDTDYTDFR
jgi:hypothetical protein